MHELPATRGILAIALDSARAAHAERITSIDICVGEMTSIVDDSIQFYFDVLAKNTFAAGARLNFRREPGQGTCLNCAAQFAVKPPLDPECPECRAFTVRVSGGNRFFVESIEVDE
jgi:hydrogenase nickel incorporation protein HypA/HybF